MHTAETAPATKHRTWWAWVVGTWFGAGFMKPGPGTYGSVAAVLIWYLVAQHVSVHWLPLITLGMAAAATAIGIPAATRVAQESGRSDPQIVVVDEVAGQWLTLMFCVPVVPFALIGLLCFRVFDILKPPPVRQLERLPAGIGIIADDLAAGVYALLLQVVLQHLLMVQQLLHHGVHPK